MASSCFILSGMGRTILASRILTRHTTGRLGDMMTRLMKPVLNWFGKINQITTMSDVN